jgi:methionyl-tRNA formyltransferase
MKIFILTQEENLYLPESLASVCQELGDRIVVIVSAPAMSTHGGALKGFWKHFRLLGWLGTWTMGSRVIAAKIRAMAFRPTKSGPFFSIKAVARAFGIPYYHVSELKSEFFESILALYQANLLISISCPQIIGKTIRKRFSRGSINVHGAPLPKYRGLMPAFWALRNGETKTAVTVHDLGAKLDDGDILLQREVSISPLDTWDSLVRRTKHEGAKALVAAVRQIENGTVARRLNPESESTYFSFPKAVDKKAFLATGRRFF